MKLVTITYPWEALDPPFDRVTGAAPVIPWQFQVVADNAAPIVNAVTGSTLPHAQIDTQRKVYEIHGPAVKGELSQSVSLSIADVTELTLTYHQDEAFGRHHQRIELELYEPFFDQVLDTVLALLRKGLQNDEYKRGNHYWLELLVPFQNKKLKRDPARYALVVDLAHPKTLMEPLQRVSDRPKRVLRRIHDQERVQKVREIDAKCLTDLAKRPGAVLAEKAGPKQRILAIRRTESIDTLENRVARHCCDLLNLVSRRYLNEHHDIQPTASKRLSSVHKLQRSALKIPRKDTFQGVRRLLEPCKQPNYTLLQNADYFRIWTAYVELVRNEDLRNQLWIWNRRMWVDFVKVYLSAIIHNFVESLGSDTIRLFGNKTVLSDRRHRWGRWLIDDGLPGPFIIEPDSRTPTTLYLIDADYEHLSRISPRLSPLASLNADVLMVSSQDGKLTVIPIYALLPSHHLEVTEHAIYLEKMLPSMMRAVRTFNSNADGVKCLGGWVMLGNWRGIDVPGEKPNLREHLTCWTTSVPSDTRKWDLDTSSWEKPLFAICGA